MFLWGEMMENGGREVYMWESREEGGEESRESSQQCWRPSMLAGYLEKELL
jgi:hypothetical protein